MDILIGMALALLGAVVHFVFESDTNKQGVAEHVVSSLIVAVALIVTGINPTNGGILVFLSGGFIAPSLVENILEKYKPSF